MPNFAKSGGQSLLSWIYRRDAFGPNRRSKERAGAARFRFLSGELLESRRLLAPLPNLLTDLNLGRAGISVHSPIVWMNGYGYFSGGYGENDRELWRTDGMLSVSLVKDIRPGVSGSDPDSFVNINGTLFFTADDGVNGRELWKSDGSAVGTVLVKDIAASPFSSNPALLTEFNGKLLFRASNFDNGDELWRSDGTAAGTFMVKDIRPGFFSSNISNIVNVNGTLFFGAAANFADYQLWKSDGTAANTIQVSSVTESIFGLDPQNLTNHNGTLYFTGSSSAGEELWKSNGTTAGTVLVADIRPGTFGSSPRQLRSLASNLFFTASNGSAGEELWVSNISGTSMVLDILPGLGSSNPSQLTVSNGWLYFVADNGVNGLEPWASFGESPMGSTNMLVDLMPGNGGSSATIAPYDTGIAIGGNYGFGLVQLFAYDGFTRNLKPIFNLIPAEVGGLTAIYDVGSGRINFVANDGYNGPQLWWSLGTFFGITEKVPPDFVQTEGSGAAEFTQIGNALYFTAQHATFGRALFKTDLATNATTLIHSAGPFGGSVPHDLVNLNGTLLFVAKDSSNIDRLWATNGTFAGTVRLMDAGFSDFAEPASLTLVNGTVFFAATAGGVRELWKTDGTVGGTMRVSDPTGRFHLQPQQLTNVNGRLFFTASYRSPTLSLGTELWTSDGTTAGTVMLKKTSTSQFGNPRSLTAVGKTLFYVASDGSNPNQLWKSDGTLAGTALVRSIASSNVFLPPSDLTNVNGTLFFTANDGVNGTELWTSNGTSAGTTLVKDIRGGGDGSSPRELTNVNGTLFFVANDGVSNLELWKSDGTAAGTVVAAETGPGAASGAPQNLVAIGGSLFFTATTTAWGREMWKSDGTATGTIQIFDTAAGPVSSSPREMMAAGRRLFFVADDGRIGEEIWYTSPEVNAPPSGSNSTVNALEDVSMTLRESDFGFSDTNNFVPDNLQTIYITSPPIAGGLFYKGLPVFAGQAIAGVDVRSGQLIYTPPPNASGNTVLSVGFVVQDDGGTSSGGIDLDPTPNTLTINVTPVNDQPVGASNSITVIDHVPYSFTFNEFGLSDPNDSPANSLLSVTIVAAPMAGTLTRNGSAISAGATVSVGSTFLFTPASTSFETQAPYTSFTFRVRDNGGTTNGGSDTDPTIHTMTINLLGTNSPPESANKTVTTFEDTPLTFSAGDFAFTDAGDVVPNSLNAIRIATLPATGKLEVGSTAVVAGDVIPVANLPLLRFTSTVNANGLAHARFTFQVQDNGGTANQGIDLDPTPNTITIDVTPVSDPPTSANKTISGREDTPYTFLLADFAFADQADASPPSSTPPHSLVSVNILVPPAASGTLRLNNENQTPGSQITLSVAQLQAGGLVFVPPAHANSANSTSPTVKFTVQDSGGTASGGQNVSSPANTLTLQLASVNDRPIGAGGAASITLGILEDQTHIFTASDFGFTDPNDSPPNALASVQFISTPTQGILRNGASALTAGSVVTASQIAAGALTYEPPPHANGIVPPLSSFLFRVRDDGGIASGGFDTDATTRTMSIAVTPVNDPPTGISKTVTINEDSAYTVTRADLGFSDANDRQQPSGPSSVAPNTLLNVVIPASPAGGTLFRGASQLASFPAQIPAAALDSGELWFLPAANANSAAAGSFRFTFQVQDDGGASNGGSNIDLIVRTISFVVNARNDPPIAAGNTLTLNEDSAITLNEAHFGFTDPSDSPPHSFTAVAITSVPVGGGLFNGTTAVTIGDFIPVSAVNTGQLRFVPSADANNINTATFGFKFRVQDSGGTSFGGSDLDAADRTMAFSVTPVNDPPEGLDTSASLLEDAAYTLKVADFGFADPRDPQPSTLAAVLLKAFPSSGELRLAGTRLTTDTLVTANRIAAGELVFVPPPNFVGTAQVWFQVQDSGGTAAGGTDLDPTPSTVNLQVSPVNDAPTFDRGADRQATDEAGPQTVLAWATNISSGPGESSQTRHFEVRGTSNPAIFIAGPFLDPDGTLRFTPAPNFSGTSLVTIVLVDSGGIGSGGRDTSNPETFSITVTKPHLWYNAAKRHDVTADGKVLAADALAIINYINAFGNTTVTPALGVGPPYYDVTANDQVSAADALAVINQLNAFGPEGEAVGSEAISGEAIDDSLVALLALDASVLPRRRLRAF